MMILAASTDNSSTAPSSLGMVVLTMLLVAMAGLVALGLRQRRSGAETQLDLEWLPLDE